MKKQNKKNHQEFYREAAETVEAATDQSDQKGCLGYARIEWVFRKGSASKS